MYPYDADLLFNCLRTIYGITLYEESEMSEQYDDFTMAYQDTCDQTVLLMIHGFPLDSAMWE